MDSGIIKRMAAMLAVAAVLVLPGCSQANPTPTPSEAPPTFEPAPAGEVQKAKIAVSTSWTERKFDSIEQKLNKALADAGQDVEFEVQTLPYVEGNSTTFLDKVRKELAEGTPSADAFLFNFVESGGLFNEGLTLDVAELVPQNAPLYYSKYKDIFPAKLTGIPVGILGTPVWTKTALMLRQDFASTGADITTTDDLFQFIKETIAEPKKPYCVLAYENDLATQWALERGYYDLSNFGIDRFLFCSVDDAGFTPVPLESIPGFADFIAVMKEYRRDGLIDYPFQNNGERECIGFVGDLSSYYVTSPYASVPYAPGEFTAQLLSPDMPGGFVDPFYINELVISATCTKEKAAQIVRFVEWMYADQANYDSMIYGTKGVDFDDRDGRYAPLVGGKPLQGRGYEQLDGLFLSWPGVQYLYNLDFHRLPASAPGNVGDLVAEGLKQNRRYPLAVYVKANRDTLDKVLAASDEMKEICRQRLDVLNKLIQGDSATITKDSIAASLEPLAKLNNKWFVEQCAAMIQKLKAGNSIRLSEN